MTFKMKNVFVKEIKTFWFLGSIFSKNGAIKLYRNTGMTVMLSKKSCHKKKLCHDRKEHYIFLKHYTLQFIYNKDIRYLQKYLIDK